MGRVKKALILRWKLLNPPQNLLKILPMTTGALHRLNTPRFSLSGRLSHFRAFSQIFDTGFSRLSPFCPFPSHHFPLALYARSIIPILRFSLVSRTQEFLIPTWTWKRLWRRQFKGDLIVSQMSLKWIATYRLLAVGPLQSEIETEVHFASLMVGRQMGCERCTLQITLYPLLAVAENS